MPVRGGQKLKSMLRRTKAEQAAMPEKLETGFFASARYPSVRTGKNGGQKQTPLPVSTVALYQEYGTRRGTPERPFMRNSAADFRNVCHPGAESAP